MSKVKTQTIRHHDTLMIRCNIEFKKDIDHDSVSVEFLYENKHAHIFSVSLGHIIKEKAIISGKNGVSIVIFHPQKDIDCVISYLKGEILVDHDTVKIPNNDSPIKEKQVEIQTIRTINKDFDSRQDEFKKILQKKRPSAWRFRMDVSEYILVTVITKGKLTSQFCFGEIGFQVQASDFLFTVDPETKKFKIPKEVFWKKNKLYSGSQLGCFELAKADFHNISNVLYKIPVSNIIETNTLPRQEERDISYFNNPLGKKFNNDWVINNSLPVLK